MCMCMYQHPTLPPPYLPPPLSATPPTPSGLLLLEEHPAAVLLAAILLEEQVVLGRLAVNLVMHEKVGDDLCTHNNYNSERSR